MARRSTRAERVAHGVEELGRVELDFDRRLAEGPFELGQGTRQGAVLVASGDGQQRPGPTRPAPGPRAG